MDWNPKGAVQNIQAALVHTMLAYYENFIKVDSIISISFDTPRKKKISLTGLEQHDCE